MTDDYAPFPEAELDKLAQWHDDVAEQYPEGTFVRSLHGDRSLACRNAILSHTALRERCLLAELALMQAKGVTA